MTEAEWFAERDPLPMLAFVVPRISVRKHRLFAIASCRRVWHLLTNEVLRTAVEVAERYADGEASEEELNVVDRAADALFPVEPVQGIDLAALWCCAADDDEDTEVMGNFVSNNITAAACDEWQYHPALLRDIVGNPFRPIVVDPAWLAFADGVVPALSHAIYDDRAFDRMPILGDALEDAGCVDRAILDHCRGRSPHVRGCWVLDLLTGRC